MSEIKEDDIVYMKNIGLYARVIDVQIDTMTCFLEDEHGFFWQAHKDDLQLYSPPNKAGYN